jgi:hypothetical protein
MALQQIENFEVDAVRFRHCAVEAFKKATGSVKLTEI